MSQGQKDKGKKEIGEGRFPDRMPSTSRMTDQTKGVGRDGESEVGVVSSTEIGAGKNRPIARPDNLPFKVGEEPLDLSPASRTPSPHKSPLKRFPSVTQVEAKRFREGIEGRSASKHQVYQPGAVGAKTPEKQTSPISKKSAGGAVQGIEFGQLVALDLSSDDFRRYRDLKSPSPFKSPCKLPYRSPKRSPKRSPYHSPYKMHLASRALLFPFSDNRSGDKQEFHTGGKNTGAISKHSREEKSRAETSGGIAAVKQGEVLDEKRMLVAKRSLQHQLQSTPSGMITAGEKEVVLQRGVKLAESNLPGSLSAVAATKDATSTVSGGSKVRARSIERSPKAARARSMGAVRPSVSKGVNDPRYENIRTGRLLKRNPHGSAPVASTSKSNELFKMPIPVYEENDRPIPPPKNMKEAMDNLIESLHFEIMMKDIDTRLQRISAETKRDEAVAGPSTSRGDFPEAVRFHAEKESLLEYKPQVPVGEKDGTGEKFVKGNEGKSELPYQKTQPGESENKGVVTRHETLESGEIVAVASSSRFGMEQQTESQPTEFPPILRFIRSFSNPQISNEEEVDEEM